MLFVAGDWEVQDILMSGHWTNILSTSFQRYEMGQMRRVVSIGTAAGAHLDFFTMPAEDGAEQLGQQLDASPGDSPRRRAVYSTSCAGLPLSSRARSAWSTLARSARRRECSPPTSMGSRSGRLTGGIRRRMPPVTRSVGTLPSRWPRRSTTGCRLGSGRRSWIRPPRCARRHQPQPAEPGVGIVGVIELSDRRGEIEQ